MATPTKMYRVVVILMSIIFCNAQVMQIKPHRVSKPLADFCNQRKTNADRSFCIQVFDCDPRSATATDFLTLLTIAVDSAIDNAKKTQEFLVELSKKNESEPGMKAVVSECISAYDGAIGQWKIMLNEFVDDPRTATYDGLFAIDELDRCKRSLEDRRIYQPEIEYRNEQAFKYGYLCEDVARAGIKS